MDDPWAHMRVAVRESRQIFNAVDAVTSEMADLLAGRLRKVRDISALRAMKKELRDFDMTTGTWKR